MDLEPAERDADISWSRRSLVTAGGAAALGGLAAALLADRAALAAVNEEEESERPNVPTEADTALLQQVIGLELAASALYRERVGPEDESEPETSDADDGGGEPMSLNTIIGVMADNHRAFAQAISGAAGVSAGQADSEVVDANLAGFTGSDDEFFATAHALEQTAVATHTSLASQYESSSAIRITASIATSEARQATVLADLLGTNDLNVFFGNDASALSLGGS